MDLVPCAHASRPGAQGRPSDLKDWTHKGFKFHRECSTCGIRTGQGTRAASRKMHPTSGLRVSVGSRPWTPRPVRSSPSPEPSVPSSKALTHRRGPGAGAPAARPGGALGRSTEWTQAGGGGRPGKPCAGAGQHSREGRGARRGRMYLRTGSCRGLKTHSKAHNTSLHATQVHGKLQRKTAAARTRHQWLRGEAGQAPAGVKVAAGGPCPWAASVTRWCRTALVQPCSMKLHAL